MNTVLITGMALLAWLVGAVTVYKVMTGMDSEAWRLFWSAFSWLFIVVVLVVMVVAVVVVKIANALSDLITDSVDWLLEAV